MRLDRSFSILLRVWLLGVAAGALHGQVLVSLGAGSGCGSLQAAQTCTLTARVTGATNQAVTWSFSPAVSGAAIGTGSAPDSTGLSTNTYKAPNFITTAQTVTATATSVADPTQAASVSISLVPVIIIVVVSPPSVTLGAGQSQQFSANVSGISQTGVTWSISPQVGSIDPSSGRYTAPSAIAASQKVTVTAASVFQPTASGTATITLQPPAITVTVSPATVTLNTGQTQQFAATLQNSTAGVTWSISPQAGTIDNAGLYTAPATIASSTSKVTVTATSIDDPTKSGTASVTLLAVPTISVTVTPAAVTLNNNQTQQFTATVQNSAAGVTWSISPQVGSIGPTGLYTSPGLITATQKVTVTAASISDSSKTGTATVTLATAIDVGLGGPASLVQEFVQAFYRNGFNLLVTLPPLGNVKKLGTTGYVQEFSDAQTSGLKDALATISPTVNTTSVVQLLGNLYGYYTSVGAATAGYPLMDSQTISGFDPNNNCEYDLFDNGYALFAYANPLATGQDFSISSGFYTEWTKVGGISVLGRPVDVVTSITAAIVPPATAGTTATVETFASGAIYTIGSGPNKSKVFSVVEPIWDLYQTEGGPSGTLGLPTSELLQVSSGVYRQTFEGGALQNTTGGGGPTLELPVAAVGLTGAPAGGAVTLNLGQTLSISAVPVDTSGSNLTDRPVSWSTTNGKVVSIQATGLTAVLTAVGGGTANVTASSGGVTSPKLTVTVIAPCCQIGDGAPSSVGQAFQAAIARNKLSIQVPVPSVAARVGNGYVQMVQSSDPNSPGSYMLAQADQSGTAYVVGGAVLARYQSLGGPAGPLGYPISDQSAGGTQLFANSAALAGNPVRLVSGAVLAKWALLGYETGAPGPPIAEAASFSTLGANSGSMQTFGFGTIYAATQGPRAGQTYYVGGLIQVRYNALGGAAGNYGMPVSDEFVTGAVHQQNFEGGNITYSVGDTAAVDHPAPKVPAVVVAPASISAGGRAHLAITGFPNNSTIRVSQTGEPDFLVTTANGAYSWDMAVPLTAKSSTLGIHAADTGSTASADGSLAIKGFTGNLAIAKVQGDNQTGLPGAMLPLSLQIALVDSTGSPVVGAPVVFQASPGAQLSVTAALTDSTGQAATFVRLPATEGVTAVTANVPSIAQAPVTFFARAAASSLSNFPKLIQAGTARLGNGTATIAQKGALLTAVASILEYHQNRAELPAPNGTADPLTLNQFLLSDCVVNPAGRTLCDGFLSNPDSGEQIVNLWRAADFTGGVDVTVQNPTAAGIADLLAQGSPALLSLGLSLNGTLAGGHFVVAIGVAADGSIVIQDPSPLFARGNLNDYLTGFTAAGGTWTATLRGVVQFALRSPSATRFMLAALSQPANLMNSLALNVQSVMGACGVPVDLLDAVDSSGNGAGGLTSRIDVCDGLQPAYQVTVGAAQPYRAFVTDLASGGSSVDVSGSAPATYMASRPQLALALAPQNVSFTANAVVNAATFTSGIAPGGIFSIFGAGLSGPGTATSVDFDGTAATVLAASPFQINAVVPTGTAPGTHTLHVVSAFGSAQQTVTVSPVAPAIFLIGNPQVGAVENQDGTLNGSSNPLPRGQVLIVYATGLGAVTQQGQLSVTTTPVTVMLNGQALPTAFAGLAPGTTGEYQVNVTIPANTPPGLAVPLALQQGGQSSNTVLVALQ
ncbi:Ig domain protein, group 2 domain protein [Candidatus Sulfopaludibacter sp. SbA6]|nr:Ig domain protein, group 2 domain protein [Candidatus Sulfopaludibacter sp. SbA6]